jgi:hypothetical protein
MLFCGRAERRRQCSIHSPLCQRLQRARGVGCQKILGVGLRCGLSMVTCRSQQFPILTILELPVYVSLLQSIVKVLSLYRHVELRFLLKLWRRRHAGLFLDHLQRQLEADNSEIRPLDGYRNSYVQNEQYVISLLRFRLLRLEKLHVNSGWVRS